MFYKPLLISPITAAYLALGTCLLSTSLMAQTPSLPKPSTIPSISPSKATSNLITNNPFIPKNNGSLNKPKNPSGPQSLTNKSPVLQKYLEFKSIAIINKKKYFSIFNKRTNKAFWIPEGETVENFRVSYYDPKNNTISISDGINTEIITIITASETPLNVASGSTELDQKVTTKEIPGLTKNQNEEKPKTPKRRRVIPVKR